ncbi:hypothetical protein K7J14_13135 [Treponema zuelzerae]|uniref:Uncharacterized protein n=1 Tax=Teretinema zuelzerae TaxID=156 RepID=A0AAE3EJ44_9SPIR|nr:hypothetical protein [Teretinema zuelzerae]MCD1655637.1 hypothetical protein [Teretinema zuelzerae]
MKRLHLFSISISACLSAFCAVSASLFLFSSCDLFTYKRSFSDEYYGEANFIESIGFDAMVPVTDPVADPEDPVTGQWDFAWRYATDWAGGNPYPYMTLTPVADANYKTAGASGYGSALPDGLSANAPVYRLELANLVTGGDFEGTTDDTYPPAGWVTTISVTSFRTFEGSGNIHGRSLSIYSGNTGETAIWNLSLADGIVDPTASYDLFFAWIKNEPISDASKSFFINETPIGLTANVETYGTEKVNFSAADPNQFTIQNNSGLISMVIDDFRIRRSLQQPRLRLLLAPNQTNPPLMNMLYRFSVWIREDPLVDAIPAPYHLDTLRVTFKQLQTTQQDTLVVQDGKYLYSSGSGWRKIVAWVSSEGNPQFTEEYPDEVLELILDLTDSSPGRVLLAQPELRAYADGY